VFSLSFLHTAGEINIGNLPVKNILQNTY